MDKSSNLIATMKALQSDEGIRDRVETIAERLGAKRSAILKWRQRGLPGSWAMRILAEDKSITAEDLAALNAPTPERAA